MKALAPFICLILLLSALVFTFAGCSGDEAASESPSESVSESASESVSESLPDPSEGTGDNTVSLSDLL